MKNKKAELKCKVCGYTRPKGRTVCAPCRVREQQSTFASPQAYRDHLRKITAARRLKKLGVTQDIYNAKLAEQGGVCAICKKPETVTRKSPLNGELIVREFCADHDHVTGKFRGLLCQRCNNGLGNFKDDLDNLREAIRYLEIASLTDALEMACDQA